MIVADATSRNEDGKKQRIQTVKGRNQSFEKD